MRYRYLAGFVLLVAIGWAALAAAQDSDGDGLPDTVEAELGTDKDFREPMVTLGTFAARSKDHPELDIVRVDFGNVAKDRWLWAVHFAKPYPFANSNLIIYLDSDNDAKTGRKGMGCEVMLSHDRGRPGVTAFAPDGANVSAPLPRVALANGVLYVCHDGPIKQESGHSAFRFHVLSETREPHAGVSSTGWTQAGGPPTSDRKKLLLLDDIAEDENFERTEGLDLIWQLQADPANVAMSSVGAELKGMAYYDAEYRWPAVRGANGSITVAVPKAGTFYPAIVVYDAAGREAYELLVDGRAVGRFVAAEDDRRQRVHFLSQPIQFKGGEKLTWRVGSAGSHITEDILLLAKRPPIRGRKFELSQIEAGRVSRDGQEQLRLTWITTWPAACTVECGPTAAYGQKITEETPVANHRVYVPGRPQGERLHYRIVAPRPDGKSVVSADAAFTFAAPATPPGTARRERAALKVENPYDFPLAEFPVTSGVPFARGELGNADNVRLLDAGGKEVVVQPRVAARWQDGSIKWLHVSFVAAAEAKSAATYTLEYGTDVKRAAIASPLKLSRDGDEIAVDTGPLRVRFDAPKSGFPTTISFEAAGEVIAPAQPMVAEVCDAAGRPHTTQHPPERIEVEEAGPVRVVVRTAGHHVSEGQPFFAYTNRFVFYAGSPLVRVEYTWGNDCEKAEFTDFESICLRLPLPKAEGWKWTVGLGNGKEAAGEGELSLRQLRDNSFEVTPPAPAGVKTERADGWLDLSNGQWGLTVAVRDFWQLYPKGFRVTPEGLGVELCPDFPEGTYDKCSKLDEIKLYYYLMGGKYKVRLGVQKQHDLMLWFHKGGLDARARQTAQAFQEPLIAACTPERYCSTGVFGEILPATAGRSPEYEEVCEKVYRGYLRHRDGGHEFGMLNLGDTWGERKVNWANGEYDHHHAFLMQFIRTADRRWYFLGERAARHAIDVDTCHHGPRRGGEWIHAMGHTGGYFKEQYEGSGIPGGGFSPSHTWTEGFYDWFALSGDPAGAENAALVADRHDGAYLNNYDWTNCRDNGWHLLLTIAAWRATCDPYYLNAARIIVERTLERQTPGGGWHRQMVPGHCHDMPRHRGEANFMLGVLANGLEEYYREVPDPRVAEAIIGGARQAIKELWVDEANGFRYTSCPNMKGYTANNDMTAEVLFFAHRLGGEPRFGEIAMRAMRAAFAGGIGSIAHLRWTPHIVYNMDLLQRRGTQAPAERR